jgi:O-antigen biosynthesis protein
MTSHTRRLNPPRQKRHATPTVPLPRRLADTTVTLLKLIRRHQRIHDFCLRTAAALMKLPGGARLVRTIQDTQRSPVAPYTEWIARFDTLSESDRRAIALHIDSFPSRPTFSVIMPIFTDNASHLRAGIESAQRQLYPATKLCIALSPAASQSQAVRTLIADAAAADPRVRIADAVADTRDAAVAKAAMALASGEFAVLFDPRHLLSERALYEMAAEIVAHPDADILFSDEDHVDGAGHRHQPVMKTGWNPEMMLSHDMVGNLKVVRRSLIESIGGVRPGFRGCRDYDLVLRASEATTATRIRHIPLVLHHSRKKTDARGADSLDHASALEVVSEHLKRTGQSGATVTPLPGAAGWLAVRRTVPSPPPLVSVIIPTRDRADVLGKCLGGLLVATDYPALEVIVADNDSCEPETIRLFDRLASDPRVRILPCPGPFNYSAINNKAIAESRGEILLLLNNDILIRHADWLTNMVAQAVRPEVGAVGARLLYENGTVQHAGVILGVGAIEPVAGNVYERAATDAPGHLNHLRIARNVSAVTAACLAMRRTVFDEVGGFDEKHLPVAFHDVDLCLKVGERGYQIICTPQAELTHLESVSRGSDLRPEAFERFKRDIAHMKRTWGRQIESDPHYGPNFHKVAVDYSLAFPPYRKKTWLREEVPASPSTPAAKSPALIPAVHGEGAATPQRYAILHIAKTAGTTLRTILSEAFPEDIFPSANDLSWNNGQYPTVAQLRNQLEMVAARRVVMGHYTLSSLLELFPDREVITCLREPFARTTSAISHLWRVEGIPPEKLLSDPTLFQNHIVNHQVRCLAPRPRAEWTVKYSESLVDQALQNLERVKIVGIQERFPQFIARVAAELQIPSRTNCDRRENVGSTAINDQLAPFADQIRELIAGDLELYRQVCLRAGSRQVP